jgi:hypothetical protein
MLELLSFERTMVLHLLMKQLIEIFNQLEVIVEDFY